jgi:hypothetical protein
VSQCGMSGRYPEFDLGDTPELFIDVSGDGDPSSVLFSLEFVEADGTRTALYTDQAGAPHGTIDRRWVYQLPAPLASSGFYVQSVEAYVSGVLRDSGSTWIYVRDPI